MKEEESASNELPWNIDRDDALPIEILRRHKTHSDCARNMGSKWLTILDANNPEGVSKLTRSQHTCHVKFTNDSPISKYTVLAAKLLKAEGEERYQTLHTDLDPTIARMFHVFVFIGNLSTSDDYELLTGRDQTTAI